MALPGIYRPSEKTQKQNRARRALPNTAKERATRLNQTKKQTNSKGKQGEGGTVTKTPHLGQILSHYQMSLM